MVINNNEVNPRGISHRKEYGVALSIAGSDSSGGAGIQADIKTFSALGVYGATAITAITAQNTQGVHSQLALPPQVVHEQVIAVMEDLHPFVIKIGMLANAEIATSVAEALANYPIPTILDPVIVSTSGHRLLSTEAMEVIKHRLLPIATLLTPNIPEMEALANMPITTYEDKMRAAEHLFGYGVRAILLKGGHEVGDTKSDILFTRSAQGIESTTYTSDTITTRNTHGTGCTLSSAIAAYIARGYDMAEAIRHAKEYVTEAIRHGADIAIGHGYGPVNHGFSPQTMYVYYENE
ncbi:MAG: bifunctional hydroxymethylpyrimidine kinase/phosphomethylpyrimidine kinase [Alistipes sp.]|nr:bifunctional hydroxymethylpyrimidine kinase/phosphomethylpyrimidine kinase [Alistipes sp.]